MKYIAIISLWLISSGLSAQTADQIIQNVDANMSAKNQIVKSSMTIHGKRRSRTLSSVTYSVGSKKSFTEYLAPSREKGTKMLKLEDKLWIYSPGTDRTLLISGHMLRQSVMGSDLSYEDMMDDRKLHEVYDSKIEKIESYNGRPVYILKLTANTDDIAYHSRKLWIDKERYVPLREDLFAKSGKLLKRTTLSDIKRINGRWFPMTILYKDMLKQGKGTEIKISDIKFNQTIDDFRFSKAALKK
ncbi:MAG: outer membrane lipoprotein-sorting protein [Bacteroidota bacterium]|nr:outer membrane lipoprotein-sorting protein [Bacteroidota bacterium]